MKPIISKIIKVLFSNPNTPNDPSKGSFMTKVLSVVIALVLWMYVIGGVNPENTQNFRNIPVQLLNTEQLKESGLVLINENEFFVNLKLRGRMSDLSDLKTEQIRAIADLRGFSKGENNVTVEVILPSTIDLQEVNPSKIKINIDQIIQKTKSIEVEYIGSTARGFIDRTPIISESEVIISGPKTYVDSVDKVVATINLNNASSDITQIVPIELLDKNREKVPHITIDKKDIEIAIPVLSIKTVPIITSTLGPITSGYELVSMETIPATAQIIGEAVVLDQIDNLKADTISLNGLSFSQTIPLNIPVPENVTIKTSSIPIVKLYIEKIIGKTLNYEVSEIKIKGLNENKKVEFLNAGNFDMIVSDIESVINSLSKEDINVMMDVTDLEDGSYNLPISIEPINKYKSLISQPLFMDISIAEK
ncbi:MAG: CdaR family protein [Peptostreptococcales bacterium]